MAGSIVVPVRASGRLVGTLGIASASEREFTTGETDDLMRAAESMARFRHGARAT
jgi:putative methionine-R-sulfoxide reductase with GAF domain